jgi:transcriptional regulator with XRE-family HTH domain
MNNRIKYIRTEYLKSKRGKKYTQKDFADEIGLSENFIWQIEKGERVPSDRTIADICRVFRVNETWLRTGAGDMEIADTQRYKLQNFFADVLSTAPDERSAFVAALDDLPAEFWPLVAELARKYADNLKKE